MILHYPVRKEQLQPLIGEPVCAVLHDGTFYYGKIESVTDDQLFLKGCRGQEKLSTDPQTARAQISGLGLGLGLAAGAFGIGIGMLGLIIGARFFI